jgi:hypothetical protein
MSLFEWIGERNRPGPTGHIKTGPPNKQKQPRYLVIIKFIISLLMIGFISYFFFGPVKHLSFSYVFFTYLAVLIYSLLGFYIHPKHDPKNMGLAGGLINHPFRYSDDINRSLFFLKVILWPGRFMSISIRDFYSLIKNRKRSDLI